MRRASSVGIDISDASIKVLQLDKDGNVVAYGTGPLPNGVVSNGLVNNKEVFTGVLTEILRNTKPSALLNEESSLRAVLCLPEAKLFTHHSKLPKNIKTNEIPEFIRIDAGKIIPFDLEDLYWDFHVSERAGERYVTFVGAPKNNVDNYIETLTFAGIKPSLIVGELFSLALSLSPDGPVTSNYMIADVGAHNTNIGAFSTDAVADMSVTVQVGGDTLTATLVEKLSLSKEAAELLKREKGLSEVPADADSTLILKTSLTRLLESLRDVKNHFESKNGQPVKYLVLAGGTALMPEITKYLSAGLGIEVRVAEPFIKIKNHEAIRMDTPAIFFANVIGLALQSIDERSAGINLLTQYRNNEDKDKQSTLSWHDVQTIDDGKYFVYGCFTRAKETATTLCKKLPIKFNIRLLLTTIFLVATAAFFVWVVAKYT